MSSQDIPNRIREWRNHRRMSLAELGEAVGLSRSEISKLESGNRRVRADHLVVLAKALKISPDELMDRETVHGMLGEPSYAAQTAPAVQVVATRRQSGMIVILRQEPAATVEAPPSLARTSGAYAFYMPDTSQEPRVPVGALLFVHPLLPARAGDLVALGLGEAPPVLASVERRSSALVAVVGGDLGAIDLNDQRVASAERIAGMWFA
ncbi:MAG TPA: helix-turn-helix domain-containing protein [Rhodospirillaceae bacterium]|nr:helix-turn-helix domain-containing protein [Rhodospirillaceae bacterium]